MTTLDLAAAGVGAGSFVVVATQGHYDEEALEQALATAARTSGWWPRGSAPTRCWRTSASRGFTDEQLSRVHAPAGMDLGSVATEEIGVAMLADLVRLRAEEGLGAVAVPAPSPRRTRRSTPSAA